MKLSELKSGTKILVPCVRCGYKRSITFHGVATYRKQLTQRCYQCSAEEKEANTIGINFSGRRRQGAMPLHEDMN